jgi:Flp pilus assembly protein TadB
MLQEDAAMNPAQHVSTLRHTHRAASSILPMLTATLTVAGAVLAAMEARTLRADDQRAANELTPANGAAAAARGQAAAVSVRAPRLTVRAYIATLVGRMLLVALGIGLVLALVYLATSTGRVGLAIILTALVLLALYLTEKVARR